MGLFDKLQKNKQNESTNINQENKYDNWKDYNISVKESIDRKKLYDFISVLLEYLTPNKIGANQYKSGHRYRYFPKRLQEAFEEEMSESNKRIRFVLEGDDFNFLIRKERLDRNIRILLSLKKDLSDELFEKIETFIVKEAMFASESDYNDELRQNSKTIYTLKNGKVTENPKRGEIIGYSFEPITSDFKKYPGYRFKTFGYGIGAFYRMWFGQGAYEILDKNALRSFSCYENVVLDNDVTRITLYKNISDYNKKANRNKQMEFRKALSIDEIADKLKREEDEEIKRNADPEINIKEGNFEHGGVRLIQTYLKDGELAHRSEADSVEERELDENGKEVFSIIKEL